VIIAFPDLPPTIWMTTGFLLLVLVVLVIVGDAVYVLYRKGIILKTN
jgi:hypothetical protein